MNLQIFHQILTGLGALAAGAAAVLTFAGCTLLPTGGYDCAASTWGVTWIPWLAAVGAVMMLLKPFVTIAQGGVAALYRPIVPLPPRDDSGKFKSP